eukprot:gb/GECG01004276.1/.p1 GENE.gb/GECG01004276.1/~~gb/GECG01004276.1/.p1  ORF type:complete len:144 (+),score=22.14 gb/GECG01004276.1/:1-432(+)
MAAAGEGAPSYTAYDDLDAFGDELEREEQRVEFIPEQQEGAAADGDEQGDEYQGDEDMQGAPTDAYEQRMTTRYMTKYERARILGTRALQLSLNAPPLVEIQGETDPLRIAMRELKENRIPIIVRRFLPDGSHEDWKATELIQ